MSKFSKDDTVKLVRCADRFMQAERRNIGKTGRIVEVVRDGSLTYFTVQLPNGTEDTAEAQGLSIVSRAVRQSSKREVAYA